MQQGLVLPGAAGTSRPRRRRWSHLLGASALAAVMLIALATLTGCGGTDTAGASSMQLHVFAAASLTDAFTKIANEFMVAHPDVKVVTSFAGSQDLVAQLQQGAPADVLATADELTMNDVRQLVTTPQPFASNRLQIVVAPGNPMHIRGLSDLSRSALKVVLCDPAVPAGAYAAEALKAAGVTVRPVSLEDNVKGVITKVSLGEADAGIVYVTDVKAAGSSVSGVDIPVSQNEIALYPLAQVRTSQHAQAAKEFIDMVMSPQGQRILRGDGFLPPAS